MNDEERREMCEKQDAMDRQREARIGIGQAKQAGIHETNPDPWKHRSAGMKCKTCMWYVQKVHTRIGVLTIGRCRKHAPTMNGYPVVFPEDFCGDHKVDETKI